MNVKSEILRVLLFLSTLFLCAALVFKNIFVGHTLGPAWQHLGFVGVAFLGGAACFLGLFFSKSQLSDGGILSLVLIPLLAALFLQPFIVDDAQNVSDKNEYFENPLFQEYRQLAIPLGLDLSFTKDVWNQREPNDYKINALYEEKPKSVDILFFGDSSISWGLIPSVIEQITGMNVGMVAYESNLLNTETTNIFDKISKLYLKDDGLVVFSFDNWMLDKDPVNPPVRRVSQAEVANWSYEEFLEFVGSRKKSVFESYLSYTSFNEAFGSISEALKFKYSFRLKSGNFYTRYLERSINPGWFEEKSINENADTLYLRWDDVSITLYNSDFENKALVSLNLQPLSPENINVEVNAAEASKVYGDNKIFMIPLYGDENNYALARSYYNNHFKNRGFGLLDLGSLDHGEFTMTMQSGSHMGNEGGLEKSIVVGEWLRNSYFGVDEK